MNTVNPEGIMGKGLALQFKKAFPENFASYERACKAGEMDRKVLEAFAEGDPEGRWLEVEVRPSAR